MMKTVTRWMLVIAALGAAVTAGAAEVSVSADLASAYVFRGATFNDGLVLQPGMEAAGFPIPESAGSLSVGVWGNVDLDDYDGALKDNAFSEVDLYASYSLPVEAFDLTVGYTEYLYPNAELEADREVSLGAGYGCMLAPSVTAYYGVDGGIKESLYVEAGIGHDLAVSDAISLGLSATLGYADPDEGESGFSHFTAGVSAGYGAVSLGLTYIGQIDDDVLPNVEDGGAYDVEMVGTLGVAMTF
jgi:uncharacterized protein (TIGR02001 family)